MLDEWAGLTFPGLPTDELHAIMGWAFEHLQRDDGGSVYLRLSTRPIDQPRRQLDPALATQGGYWLREPGAPAELAIISIGAVTPEAIEPLFEKRMEGFSIAFHMLSHAKIGASTIQSRATAGTAGATFIFCLPGSPGACRDGWDGILSHQLDYRTKPCNFVEIMPRLDEHLRRPKAKGASV